MAMTDDRWQYTTQYVREVFGAEPEHIRVNRESAEAIGLPTWAVSPEMGRLLALLVTTTQGRLALEVGTLGGYSTLWLLEGMHADGRVVTVEYDDRHADFSEGEFARCEVADRVDLRRGSALDLLPGIAAELGPGSVDVVFIDADKDPLPEYYEITSDLVAPGGLLLVDNILGTGSSWIDEVENEGIIATDRMNRLAADDDRFDTAGVFAAAGLLIARRRA